MNLDYVSGTSIKLKRCFPLHPNYCRQTVVANAINFFHKHQVYTPEEVLVLINKERANHGIPEANLNSESLTDEEIDTFVSKHGQGITLKRVFGGKYLDTSLWRQLVDHQFILVPDHQSLYTDPLNPSRNELSYLPPDLLDRLVASKEFSYKNLIDLYTFFINRAGKLDDGHVDVVLDFKPVNNRESVILANLVSTGHEPLMALPWHLYKNYLSIDWTTQKPITRIDSFPSQFDFLRLVKNGHLTANGYDFIYGALEIYFPVDRRNQLDKLLLCTT